MPNTLAVYVHDIDPFAIQFSDWSWWPDWLMDGVRWYGLSYLAGFIIAYYLIKRVTCCGRSTMKTEHVADLIFYYAVGIVIGGRVGYAIFYMPSLWGFAGEFPFWRMLMFHHGGMASHGGMIGLIVASWMFARKYKHDWAHILDLGAFAAPLGLFFGRLANFVNGELYGRGPTDVAWAVKFPQEIVHWNKEQLGQLNPILNMMPEALSYDDIITAIQYGNHQVAAAVEPMLTARHPSQIYQALMEGLVLFVFLAIVWMKPRRPMVLGSLTCMAYGVLRIAGEVFREPDAHIGFQWLGLTRGQWLSVAMLAAGVLLLIMFARRPVKAVGGWRKLSASE